jgi:hypothetical protein
MSFAGYLLDENVGPVLGEGLHRRRPEIVVWSVGQPGAPPLGTLDPEILVWCEANDFALVTNNRASMPVHLQEHLSSGGHVPGIFVLARRLGLGATIEALALLHGASEPAEFADRITHLQSAL